MSLFSDIKAVLIPKEIVFRDITIKYVESIFSKEPVNETNIITKEWGIEPAEGRCLNYPGSYTVFNSYAYYDQYGMSNIALEVFKEYQDKVRGSIEETCINCGLCEKKCSHSTPIRKNLKAVEKFMNDLNITSNNFKKNRP